MLCDRVPAHQESGAGPLSLAMQTSDQFSAAVAPTLEIGGRVNLAHGVTLRPYAGLGLLAYSNRSWQTQATFVFNPAATAPFAYDSSLPVALATTELGIDVGGLRLIAIQAEYKTQCAGNYLGQMGMLKFTYRF
jgi:hypothetical protein